MKAAVCSQSRAVVAFRPPPAFAPCGGGEPLRSGVGAVRALLARVHDDFAGALRVLRVKGDGRCLFRSIAKVLAYNSGRNLSENLEREDADALREAAYNVICVEKRAEFSQKGIVEGSMASYCQRLRRPDFYGGEPEMYVLSLILERPIAVYVQVSRGHFQKLVEYGSEFAKLRRKGVRVLYNGSNHYDALAER